MPTITIRVTEQERASLEGSASRSGKTLSAYVREALSLRDVELIKQVQNHETRLRRVERRLADHLRASHLSRTEEVASLRWEDIDAGQ